MISSVTAALYDFFCLLGVLTHIPAIWIHLSIVSLQGKDVDEHNCPGLLANVEALLESGASCFTPLFWTQSWAAWSSGNIEQCLTSEQIMMTLHCMFACGCQTTSQDYLCCSFRDDLLYGRISSLMVRNDVIFHSAFSSNSSILFWSLLPHNSP